MVLIKDKKECGNVILKNDEFISDFTNVRVIDKVKFICNDCGKETTKEVRKFIKPIENNLLCGSCIRKRIYLEKYGVENPQQVKEIREKTLNTMNKKYGGNAPLCSDGIKEKIRNTNIEKYGVENVFQNKEIKEKIKETNLEKYGVENSMLSEEVREKAKLTRLKNFYNSLGRRVNNVVVPLFDIEESRCIASDKKNKVLWKCNKCGNEFYDHIYGGRIPICKKCHPPSYSNGISNKELELKEFIENLGLKTEKFYYRENNNGRPREIDIYIKEKNIAIEFNGLYWHSEQKLRNSGKEPKKYHLNKTKMCNNLGIRLIHIFEDEWDSKKDIIKSRLKNIFGIYENRIGGREVIVKEIEANQKNIFLNNYHIQGEDKSSFNLGAFKDDSLVSVMTFCKPRIAMGQKNIENKIYELSRFASVPNTAIPGIASKMLKYFIKNFEVKKIYTYSDVRWNTGNLYKNLGFSYIKTTQPNYWYIINGNRFHRFKYRKQELPNLLENFNPNLTEYQNMLNNSYDRIWDCGNDKWELIIS